MHISLGISYGLVGYVQPFVIIATLNVAFPVEVEWCGTLLASYRALFGKMVVVGSHLMIIIGDWTGMCRLQQGMEVLCAVAPSVSIEDRSLWTR